MVGIPQSDTGVGICELVSQLQGLAGPARGAHWAPRGSGPPEALTGMHLPMGLSHPGRTVSAVGRLRLRQSPVRSDGGGLRRLSGVSARIRQPAAQWVGPCGTPRYRYDWRLPSRSRCRRAASARPSPSSGAMCVARQCPVPALQPVRAKGSWGRAHRGGPQLHRRAVADPQQVERWLTGQTHCRGCGAALTHKDSRSTVLRTVYGKMTVKSPRLWSCAYKRTAGTQRRVSPSFVHRPD